MLGRRSVIMTCPNARKNKECLARYGRKRSSASRGCRAAAASQSGAVPCGSRTWLAAPPASGSGGAASTDPKISRPEKAVGWQCCPGRPRRRAVAAGSGSREMLWPRVSLVVPVPPVARIRRSSRILLPLDARVSRLQGALQEGVPVLLGTGERLLAEAGKAERIAPAPVQHFSDL